MKERPNGKELLATARNVLKSMVLPQVHPTQKHNLLMCLNAMSIAEREFDQGDAEEREELSALNLLLGRTDGDLVAGNRQLALLLREGVADKGSERRDEFIAHLKRVARARLAVSNPRAIDG